MRAPVLLALFTAFAMPAAATAAPTLRLAELAAPTLDPALASSPDAVLIQNALCDRLYTTSAEGVIVPQIATGMPVAGPSRQRPKQWTTYTIHLSGRYRFQDGSPVTAYSFAEAFARDADPDQQSRALSELNQIVGVAAVAASEASNVTGVVAANDTTLEITSMHADPDLAQMLAQPYFCPVLEDTPIAPNGLSVPPSAGPYYVQTNDGSEIVLARNPYYGGRRRAAFGRISLRTGVAFASCRRDVSRGTVELCLDALPQHATIAPLASLVAQGWISPKLGCLSWQPVVRIDLVSLCAASTG
jgi:ABC-type transport system substrate-binding protein